MADLEAAAAAAKERAERAEAQVAELQATVKRLEASEAELRAQLANSNSSLSEQLGSTVARLRAEQEAAVAEQKALLAAQEAKQKKAEENWDKERLDFMADMELLEKELARLKGVDDTLVQTQEANAQLTATVADLVRVASSGFLLQKFFSLCMGRAMIGRELVQEAALARRDKEHRARYDELQAQFAAYRQRENERFVASPTGSSAVDRRPNA